MADISVAINDEILHLIEQLIVPTRLYFQAQASGNSATPSLAADAAWNSSGAMARRGLRVGNKKYGTSASSVTVTSSGTNPEKICAVQFASPPLRAQTIAGNVTGQFRCFESNTGFNGTLQIGIRVVSYDGTTVRATLLAVQGSTDTSSTPPEIVVTTGTNRQILTAAGASPLPLSSYTCVEGDRLVIEIGLSDKDSGTSRTGSIVLGDNTTDLPTDQTTTTALDPWIEFDSIVSFTTELEILKLADGPVAGLLDPEQAGPSESLKIQDSLTAGINLDANPSETLKLAETGGGRTPELDPIQAGVADEAIHVVDNPPSLQLNPIIVLVSDEVLHVVDSTPTGAFPGGGSDLSRQVTAESIRIFDELPVIAERLKLADSVTAAIAASSDLGVSVADEVLKLVDGPVTGRLDPLQTTAALVETLKLADGPVLGQVDPEQASLSESLKVSDTVTPALLTSGSASQGFDFRQTSGFVTDPSGCTYVLETDTYPISSRGNFVFGWLDAPGGSRDRTAFLGQSAKVAGIHFGQTAQRFRVDLGGAGTADIRLAMGDADGTQTQMQVKVKDNTTVRLTIGPHDTSANTYYDASDVSRSPDTDWVSNNVAATGVSFASGILILTLEGPAGVSNTTIAHLSIDFTATAGDLSASPSEALKVQDALSAQLDTLRVAIADEALKVQDAASAFLDPLIRAITDESLKVQDTVTASLGGLFASIVDESLKVQDTLSGQLTPLVRAIADDSLKVQDTVSGALSGGDLSVSVAVESLRIFDQLPVIAERVKVSDTVTAALSVSGDLSIAITTESLKVADTVFPEINPPLAALLIETILLEDSDLQRAIGIDELLRLADGPVSAALVSAGGDLSRQVTDENLKVQDALLASMGDLVVLITQEALKVQDTLTASENPLEASASESLKVQDTLLASMGGLFAAVAQEALKVQDALSSELTVLQVVVATESLKVQDAVTVSEDPLEASPSESLKISENAGGATPYLDPIQVGVTTESLKVQDTVLASTGSLVVFVTDEVLRVLDAQATTLDPEQVAVTTESLKIQDTVTAALERSVSITQEALKVQDTVTAKRDLDATPSESLKIQDTVTALEPVLQAAPSAEILTLSDVLASGVNLLSGIITNEQIHVVDTVSATLILFPVTDAPTTSIDAQTVGSVDSTWVRSVSLPTIRTIGDV